TLVHETGHWTGLYHVFQGGCTGEGDQVGDTPPQEDATDGCPANKDTCSGGGLDSIHNYMDYSDDACLDSFTDGQIDRLWGQISSYRGF
ncbi:pregnancy-associated plasma protein-A-domain-containing protein, partial [Cyathus striatus]